VLRGSPETGNRQICLEIIQENREIPSIRGIHVMAYRQGHLVAEISEEAKLLPRGVPRERAQWT